MSETVSGPVPLQDCNGIIDPSVFPVPTLDHVEFHNQAHALRLAGEAVAQTGDDIVASWGGLSTCYTAPESETLLSALAPVSDKGVDVEAAMDRAATALGAFAEEVRQIKSAWSDLTGAAHTFRNSVVDDPDWDKADHWATMKSSNVEKSNELKGKAEGLIGRYERAQRDCANAINAELYGRTQFSNAASAVYLTNAFVYDSINTYVDAPSAWGPNATSDLFWHQDALRAVDDFAIGAAEGVGGMVGAYSDGRWFEKSWGDALKDYHWDNLTAAAALVGMYDAESDSLAWSGAETIHEAWKDLAHAIVPWEEWDDSPGYVLAMGALNIGSLGVGVALTVTGVGAVAGVPLLAWRGLDILDGMSNSGRRGSSDVDLTDLPEIPGTGGNGQPVTHIDTTGMSPSQLAELKRLLEDLALAQSGGSGPNQSNGSEHGPTGGDLNRTEEALSPEPGNRGNDSDPGSKNSDGNGPSDWLGDAGPRPNDRGSESQPALVGGGGGGNNNTLTESRGTPASPPPRANATDTDAPGTGTGNRSDSPATPGSSDGNTPSPTPVDRTSSQDAEQSPGSSSGDGGSGDNGDPPSTSGDQGEGGQSGQSSGSPDSNSGTSNPSGLPSSPDPAANYPGEVGSDGVRRFATDAEGLEYGNRILDHHFDGLSPEQKHTVRSYTEKSYYYNSFSRASDKDAAIDHIMGLDPPYLGDWLREWFGGPDPTAGNPGEVRRVIEENLDIFDSSFTERLPEAIAMKRGLREVDFMLDPSLGIDSPHKLQGSTFTEEGFLSGTMGGKAAFNDPKDHPFQLEILVPEGNRAMWVGQNSKYPDQNEMILPRGSSIVFESVRQDPATGSWELVARVEAD
ncbi:hypothetical protein NE857_06735 [Nocardiopsis exhalans]|uniref:ADP ribosyltransferase domain-containing protein n=1 Tax=Nocardiopsis exhalans TaxID=163604 RepID=A0ABY5DD51_9ACTN|nr:ADP-ribosyltransferase [Nocardiopsis exhalans]USY21310.1 hypothetical protein NE857_06735 [Nocardiopsis exhalans]